MERWPNLLPRDPEELTPLHLAELLNVGGPEFYAKNCRAFPEGYVDTVRYLAIVFRHLLRVRATDNELSPPQRFAFFDLWAGFNTLLAAVNILRLGHPFECILLLRSARMSLFHPMLYCDDPEVFEKVKREERVSSSKIVAHASTVLPSFQIDGEDNDVTGMLWGYYSHHFAHARTGMAILRTISVDEENLRLGPMTASNPEHRPKFDEALAHVNKACADYIVGIEHIYPFLPTAIDADTGRTP